MALTFQPLSIARPRSYWQRLKKRAKSLFATLAMLARAFTLLPTSKQVYKQRRILLQSLYIKTTGKLLWTQCVNKFVQSILTSKATRKSSKQKTQIYFVCMTQATYFPQSTFLHGFAFANNSQPFASGFRLANGSVILSYRIYKN